MTAVPTPPYRQVAPVVDGPGWTAPVVTESQDPYQCQGCGAVRYGSHWRDKGHACWRNEDGTYEEGGTFQ